MSRIESVVIRRFKRLQEISINLGDVTLLIGANNAGKSSILQAIHFAVSIAQTARLVGEGVSWRNDTFEVSFNPTQLNSFIRQWLTFFRSQPAERSKNHGKVRLRSSL